MPVMTSLMVLILSSVRAAVLLLRGIDVRWASVTTAQLSSAAAAAAGGTGRDQGSMIPYSSSVLTSQENLLQVQILLGSQPFSPTQGVTWRTYSTGWGRPEVSQVKTPRPRRSRLGREGKKTLNPTGKQCLCCDKTGVKCWGAEKIGLLIPLGKESKSSEIWYHWNRASNGKKHLSTARQERKLQIDKNITCKVTKKKKKKKTFKQHNTPITWQPGQWPTSNPLGPASGLYHHH